MVPESRKRDWFSTDKDSDAEDVSDQEGNASEDYTEAKVHDSKRRKRAESESAGSDDDDVVEKESAKESRAGVTSTRGSTKIKDNTALRFAKLSDDEDDEDDEDDDDDDEEEAHEDEEDEEEEEEDEEDNDPVLRRITPAELAANRAKIANSGVIYLSRIPPYMKPAKVRQLLSRFGALGRVFLAPEDAKSYAKRVRFGGNKKRCYVEGWVEFIDKKQAKLCASTMNGNIIGGRKGSYYYDDILNMKYLPKFKWHNLTEQIAYENQSRQAKLRAEITQAAKENKAYVRNVERAKMIDNMKRKRREKAGKAETDGGAAAEEPLEIRRNFKQRVVKDKSAQPKPDAPLRNVDGEAAMQRVLGSIFG
ncbi:uncharacterized protein V1518DRAFT_418308 [Limtongia smithiae]|uniref:uncharacterized protein n=1 Tax=Limtongia smithiae TaxID=1125753 RepID=UPI0034CFD47C